MHFCDSAKFFYLVIRIGIFRLQLIEGAPPLMRYTGRNVLILSMSSLLKQLSKPLEALIKSIVYQLYFTNYNYFHLIIFTHYFWREYSSLLFHIGLITAVRNRKIGRVPTVLDFC